MNKREFEKIQRDHEAAKLQHDIAVMEAESKALRGEADFGIYGSGKLAEAWGDILDPLEYLYDSPGFVGAPSSALGAGISDRSYGQNLPVYQTETELQQIRATARSIAQVSPAAKGALANLDNYTLGTGYDYKVVTGEGQPEEPKLKAAVQACVNGIIRKNKLGLAHQQERFNRRIRDGEVIRVIFNDGTHYPSIRFLEPEQLTEPQNPEEWERRSNADRPGNWAFGVHTADGDNETIYGYHFRWRTPLQDTCKYFPESRVVHTKRNVDRNIKRGVSDFYAVYESLLDAAKLVRNSAKGAAILSAIALIREHATGTTQSGIESQRSSNAWLKYTQQTRSEGSRTKYVHKFDPGTILDVVGTQYKPSPLASQGVGSATVEINGAVMRWVGSNWCMPAFMVLGGGDATAYAAALVSESPWVKYCQAQQIENREDDLELLWKALRVAWQNGAFEQYGVDFDDIMRLLDIHVGMPTVEARQKTEETNRHKVLNDAGVMSDQTWAEKEGLDYDREQERGAKRQATGPSLGDTPGMAVDGTNDTRPHAETAGGINTGKPQAGNDTSEANARLWNMAGKLFEGYP